MEAATHHCGDIIVDPHCSWMAERRRSDGSRGKVSYRNPLLTGRLDLLLN
jgi:hypothetical protein